MLNIRGSSNECQSNVQLKAIINFQLFKSIMRNNGTQHINEFNLKSIPNDNDSVRQQK